ncbi:MAG: aerobic carbon-monoxide dehydrogenase large subunit [Mycobacterium sp.]|nr:aerobic carbon-monoxide dehydrogenase large subunit [Mycobacterium sp.]
MTDTVATRYAGTRVARVEDNRLLTGRGTFVDDVTRPGMLHACFVRSPFARAKINGIDAGAALDLAHSTCDALNNAGKVNDALNMLTKKTKWSVQKSADCGGLAVYAYCRDKLPAGAGS